MIYSTASWKGHASVDSHLTPIRGRKNRERQQDKEFKAIEVDACGWCQVINGHPQSICSATEFWHLVLKDSVIELTGGVEVLTSRLYAFVISRYKKSMTIV